MNPTRVERLAVGGTALFAAVALAGAVGPRPLVVASIVVDLVLFVIGCAAFVLSLVRAAGRSRTEAVTVTGLWFLQGSAPRRVRRLLLGALAVQVVVALTMPFAEPDLAFGVLVPTFGVGCTGLWAALAGEFGPRVHRSGRR